MEEMCWYIKNKMHLNFDNSTLAEVFQVWKQHPCHCVTPEEKTFSS